MKKALQNLVKELKIDDKINVDENVDDADLKLYAASILDDIVHIGVLENEEEEKKKKLLGPETPKIKTSKMKKKLTKMSNINPNEALQIYENTTIKWRDVEKWESADTNLTKDIEYIYYRIDDDDPKYYDEMFKNRELRIKEFNKRYFLPYPLKEVNKYDYLKIQKPDVKIVYNYDVLTNFIFEVESILFRQEEILKHPMNQILRRNDKYKDTPFSDLFEDYKTLFHRCLEMKFYDDLKIKKIQFQHGKIEEKFFQKKNKFDLSELFTSIKNKQDRLLQMINDVRNGKILPVQQNVIDNSETWIKEYYDKIKEYKEKIEDIKNFYKKALEDI